jgi:hypothetical protein
MPLHIEGVAVIDKGRRPPCPVQPRPGNLTSNTLSYKSIPPTVDCFVTDFELTGSQIFGCWCSTRGDSIYISVIHSR